MLNLLDIIGMTTEPGAGVARPFDLRGGSATAEVGIEFTSLFENMMARFTILGAPDLEASLDPNQEGVEETRRDTERGVDAGVAEPLPFPLADPTDTIARPFAQGERPIAMTVVAVPQRPSHNGIVASGSDLTMPVAGLEPLHIEAVPQVPGQIENEVAKPIVHVDGGSHQIHNADVDTGRAFRAAANVQTIVDTDIRQRETSTPLPQPIPAIETTAPESDLAHPLRIDEPRQGGADRDAAQSVKSPPAGVPVTKPVPLPGSVRFVPADGQTRQVEPETQVLPSLPRAYRIASDAAADSGQPNSNDKTVLPATHHSKRSEAPFPPRVLEHVTDEPIAPRLKPTVPEEVTSYAPPTRPQVLPEERPPTSRAKRLPVHNTETLTIEPVDREPVVGFRRPEPVVATTFTGRATNRTHGGDDLPVRTPAIVEGDLVEPFRPADLGAGLSHGPLAPGVVQEARGRVLVSGAETLGRTIENEVVESLNRLESRNEEFVAEIRLQPRELGNVRIRISVSDHRVDLQLFVDSKEVRQLVQSHANELRVVLEDKGYSLTDINVFVSGDRDSHDGLQDHSDHGRLQSEGVSDEQDDSQSSSMGHVLTEKRVNLLV